MYKDFDIERAKKGDPVLFKHMTTEGYTETRIVCFDRKSTKDRYPIVALIDFNSDETMAAFDIKGRDPNGVQRLFMAPIKRQEWVNIHYVLGKEYPNGQYYVVDANTFKSEQDAIKFVEEKGLANYMKSVKIREWEE